VIVLYCVVWAILNRFFGLSAYVTKNTVDVEQFLRPQRFPKTEQQPLSTTIITIDSGGCCRLLSITID
jgi:hypothetical protein